MVISSAGMVFFVSGLPQMKTDTDMELHRLCVFVNMTRLSGLHPLSYSLYSLLTVRIGEVRWYASISFLIVNRNNADRLPCWSFGNRLFLDWSDVWSTEPNGPMG